MEFRFRAGESKAEPWTPEALPPPPPPPPPPPSPPPSPKQASLEALQRELEEEKIKEEILARRLNQKRMREELQREERALNFEAPIENKKRKVVGPAALENARTGRLLQPARREWSCALCMVSATDEEGLKDHLKGKKHVKKAAELGRGKGKSKHKQEEGASGRSGKRMVRVAVDGRTEWVVERGAHLLCERCGVKCNSKEVMVAHLSGKKHMKQTLV